MECLRILFVCCWHAPSHSHNFPADCDLPPLSCSFLARLNSLNLVTGIAILGCEAGSALPSIWAQHTEHRQIAEHGRQWAYNHHRIEEAQFSSKTQPSCCGEATLLWSSRLCPERCNVDLVSAPWRHHVDCRTC